MFVLHPKPRSSMKKKKHSPEQIITHLRKLEALTAQGATIAQAAKQIGVSEQSLYRWKRQYGGLDHDQAKRLKALEKENTRLKKLVVDLALDKDILQEALSGKY